MALSPASGNFLIHMSLLRLSRTLDGDSAIHGVLCLCSPLLPGALPESRCLGLPDSQLCFLNSGTVSALPGFPFLSQLAVSPAGLTSSVSFLSRIIILCYLMPSVLPLLSHKVLVAQSCLTHCDPLDCSPPVSSVHVILQTTLPE